MKAILPLIFIIIISGICIISCDDNIGGCFGVNLEDTPCASENILSIGQQDGLSCFRCTGEETGDQFSIFWRAIPLAGTPNLGTQFGFLNTTDAWIAEFTDCETLTLYETSLGGPGGFVKGELAGTLAGIDPFQIDKLSLFIDIPGVRTESAVCDFCTSSNSPVCF